MVGGSTAAAALTVMLALPVAPGPALLTVGVLATVLRPAVVVRMRTAKTQLLPSATVDPVRVMLLLPGIAVMMPLHGESGGRTTPCGATCRPGGKRSVKPIPVTGA